MTASHPDLFHATSQSLSPGQIVAASAPGTYYPAVVGVLESKRPSHLPSRSVCVFASEKPAASSLFLAGQGVAPSCIRLYRVEMSHFHRAPFRIVHELQKRLDSSRAVDRLVEEYWRPKENWNFFEYFGPSFIVLEEIPPVREMDLDLFRLAYGNDLQLSDTL